MLRTKKTGSHSSFVNSSFCFCNCVLIVRNVLHLFRVPSKNNKLPKSGGEFMPSHGSLSKAGKVRAITPKVEAKERHTNGPRVTNSSNYHKRIVLDRGLGQYKPGKRRRRRRR